MANRYLTGLYILIGLVVSVAIFSLMRPSYNHLTQAFSELGQLGAPNYILFNIVVFEIFGVINLYFIQQVIKFFEGKLAPTVYWCHRLAILSWMFTGIFPLSDENRWLHNVHIAGAVSSYLFGSFTMFLYMRHFSRYTTGFALFSLISTIFLFGVWLVILYSNSVVPRPVSQLIAIVSFFVWQAIFSILLYVKSVRNVIHKS